MASWVGPAIVAAVIAAVVSVAGWFVSAGQALRAERRHRIERMRDFQIALRAEVRAELADLEGQDFETSLAIVWQRSESEAGYTLRVPTLPPHVIFDAILPQISILPEEIIDPVVLYVRQRQVVAGVVADIRDPTFASLSRDRQREIVREYVSLLVYLRELARMADAALSRTTPT